MLTYTQTHTVLGIHGPQTEHVLSHAKLHWNLPLNSNSHPTLPTAIEMSSRLAPAASFHLNLKSQHTEAPW